MLRQAKQICLLFILLNSTLSYAGSGVQLELSNTDFVLGIFNDTAFEESTPELSSNFGNIYTEGRIAALNGGDHIVLDGVLEVARQVYQENFFANVGIGIRPAIISLKRNPAKRDDLLAFQFGLKGYMSKEIAGQIKMFGELSAYYSPKILTLLSSDAEASKYLDAKIGINIIANTAVYAKLVRYEVDYNGSGRSVELANTAMLGLRIGL